MNIIKGQMSTVCFPMCYPRKTHHLCRISDQNTEPETHHQETQTQNEEHPIKKYKWGRELYYFKMQGHIRQRKAVKMFQIKGG